MSMCRVVACCLLVAYLTTLFAETTKGHITFFSPKEMMLMKQEQEGKKDMEPRSEDNHIEEVTVQQHPPSESDVNTDKTVEIEIRLSPKELDHVAPVLEEIIHDMVEERQKAK